MSSAMPSVLIARFSTEVKATSKTNPASPSRRPASRASSTPRSVRSTSVQPVNRFSLFHVLSPWRSRTTLYMVRASHSDDGCEQLPGRVRPLNPYRAAPGESRLAAELLFNPQQLVVLADAVRAAC